MKRTILILFLLLPLITKEGGVRYDVFYNFNTIGLNQFKSILAFKESSNNPLAVGRNHYRGLYSFGISAAKDVNVSYDSLFIPKWSDTALVRYMRLNWKYLKGYHHYEGRTINNIKVTKAGMLAGAHLKGHIWVKKWLKSNGRINGKDLNGTSVKDYVKLMENVELINY